MGFFEKETVLELLRPAAVIATIFLIESTSVEHSTKVVIGVIAIFFLAALDFVLRKGAKFSWLRHHWYKISRFEGLWLQRVGNLRPYSIAWIDYDADGRWLYYGIGYNAAFEPTAEWHTTSWNNPAATDKFWYFSGEAELIKYDRKLHKTDRVSRGDVIPIIYLRKDSDKLNGEVIDLRVGRANEVFDISLFPAHKQSAVPAAFRGLEDFKKMTAEQLRQLFADNNVPLD
jgi:hypothetical protein